MDDLENIGTKLSGIKKENPFRIPEKYFDDLSSRISDRIHTGSPTSHPSRIIMNWKPYLAAASLIFAVFFAGSIALNQVRMKKADKVFHAEISRTVEQELYSISEETILEVMETGGIETHPVPEISSEDAMEYLLNENLNEEELFNSL